MSDVLFPNYQRYPVRFTYGKGAILYDRDHQPYLDFASGIAVCSLGHAHPALVSALQKQAQSYWHSSNLYESELQITLAQQLLTQTFKDNHAGQVIFCNSGAEAIETALKTARRYQFAMGRKKRTDIIGFHSSFHGRTMACLGASGQKKYLQGFGPKPRGYHHIAVGDMDSLQHIIETKSDKIAGIIIEPIQGEGGINVIDNAFLQQCAFIAQQHNIVFIVDEVQCGVGRSGKFWAYQYSSIQPDLIVSAKGLGGGFPVGAVIAKKNISSVMQPGTHGTTYGGNPLAMAVASKVVDIISDQEFLQHIQNTGEYFDTKLHQLAESYPLIIKEIRGKALMKGIALHEPYTASDLVKKLLHYHFLCVPAGGNVIRLLPPLIITKDHIDKACHILTQLCQQETRHG